MPTGIRTIGRPIPDARHTRREVADAGESVIQAYRLHFALDDALHDTYRGFGMALDEHNADGTWSLPVPATFVLDRHGIARARHVDPNYRERMAVDDVLATLDALA